MKDGTLLEVGICHILRYRESSLAALLRPSHSGSSKHILVGGGLGTLSKATAVAEAACASMRDF